VVLVLYGSDLCIVGYLHVMLYFNPEIKPCNLFHTEDKDELDLHLDRGP